MKHLILIVLCSIVPLIRVFAAEWTASPYPLIPEMECRTAGGLDGSLESKQRTFGGAIIDFRRLEFRDPFDKRSVSIAHYRFAEPAERFRSFFTTDPATRCLIEGNHLYAIRAFSSSRPPRVPVFSVERTRLGKTLLGVTHTVRTETARQATVDCYTFVSSEARQNNARSVSRANALTLENDRELFVVKTSDIGLMIRLWNTFKPDTSIGIVCALDAGAVRFRKIMEFPPEQRRKTAATLGAEPERYTSAFLAVGNSKTAAARIDIVETVTEADADRAERMLKRHVTPQVFRHSPKVVIALAAYGLRPEAVELLRNRILEILPQPSEEIPVEAIGETPEPVVDTAPNLATDSIPNVIPDSVPVFLWERDSERPYPIRVPDN